MDLLKSFMEKRNSILGELKNFEGEIKEERSADEKTLVEIRGLKEELNMIEAAIKKLEEEENTVEVREEENMNKEMEVRKALADFIAKREVREEVITVQEDGSATIPENVENTIIEKLTYYSEAFAESRRIPSQSGSLKIPRETKVTKAGFVGELEDVEGIKLNIDQADLTQKRVGAYTILTKQLINDTAVDIVKYAEDNLSRSAVLAIEESIFQGKGKAEDEFDGIINDKDIKTVEADEVTLDTLIDMDNELHPTFVPSAKYYMTHDMYKAVSKLKDGNGHPYVQNGVVNGVLTKTLFEKPIVITEGLPKENPIVLGSLGMGYTIMVKQGMSLEHITADSLNALRGTELLVLDAFMDGTVHNPQAFVVLSAGAGGTVGE